jgi:2-oxoacid:acceptor oxidoreductase delta subunit (pyruvate/2-ketoisovalerate family)
VIRYETALELPPTPMGRESTEAQAKASWRTFRPVIDLGPCTQCNLCWKFCPDVAVAIDDEGWPQIRYDFCKGCGICAEVCAPGAIVMEREG